MWLASSYWRSARSKSARSPHAAEGPALARVERIPSAFRHTKQTSNRCSSTVGARRVSQRALCLPDRRLRDRPGKKSAGIEELSRRSSASLRGRVRPQRMPSWPARFNARERQMRRRHFEKSRGPRATRAGAVRRVATHRKLLLHSMATSALGICAAYFYHFFDVEQPTMEFKSNSCVTFLHPGFRFSAERHADDMPAFLIRSCGKPISKLIGPLCFSWSGKFVYRFCSGVVSVEKLERVQSRRC